MGCVKRTAAVVADDNDVETCLEKESEFFERKNPRIIQHRMKLVPWRVWTYEKFHSVCAVLPIVSWTNENFMQTHEICGVFYFGAGGVWMWGYYIRDMNVAERWMEKIYSSEDDSKDIFSAPVLVCSMLFVWCIGITIHSIFLLRWHLHAQGFVYEISL